MIEGIRHIIFEYWPFITLVPTIFTLLYEILIARDKYINNGRWFNSGNNFDGVMTSLMMMLAFQVAGMVILALTYALLPHYEFVALFGGVLSLFIIYLFASTPRKRRKKMFLDKMTGKDDMQNRTGVASSRSI